LIIIAGVEGKRRQKTLAWSYSDLPTLNSICYLEAIKLLGFDLN